MTIQIALPAHLRTLANVDGAVAIPLAGDETLGAALDGLEARYPVLRGTIRDHVTKERRPFIRFFMCGEDWSHEGPDAALPEAVLSGEEPLRVIGALAGG